MVFRRIHALLEKAERILLVADGKPDGDSIGSTAAMALWLKQEKKQVRTFCALSIPSPLSYVNEAHDFTNDPAIFHEPFDLVITFDAGDLRHCGIEQLLPQIPSAFQLVVFDHHATNTRYGQVNAVWTDACSTAELVYQFFIHEQIPIDSGMATSLLTGILYDTSSFSNAATTSSGMEAAAHLCALGARHPEILRRLVKNKSVPGLRLWGLALARLQKHTKLDLTWTYFLQEDLHGEGKDEEALEGVSNFLNAVCGGSDTFLVLREMRDGTIRGSLRSVGRDISQVAKLFGGGGHKKAAGFTVRGRLREENGRVRIDRS